MSWNQSNALCVRAARGAGWAPAGRCCKNQTFWSSENPPSFPLRWESEWSWGCGVQQADEPSAGSRSGVQELCPALPWGLTGRRALLLRPRTPSSPPPCRSPAPSANSSQPGLQSKHLRGTIWFHSCLGTQERGHNPGRAGVTNKPFWSLSGSSGAAGSGLWGRGGPGCTLGSPGGARRAAWQCSASLPSGRARRIRSRAASVLVTSHARGCPARRGHLVFICAVFLPVLQSFHQEGRGWDKDC